MIYPLKFLFKTAFWFLTKPARLCIIAWHRRRIVNWLRTNGFFTADEWSIREINKFVYSPPEWAPPPNPDEELVRSIMER